MATEQQVLALARAEDQYVEGTGNRTKFAAIAGHLNGQPWCATFIVAIFRLAGMRLPSESAYTPAMADGFKKAGRWGSTPRVGAVVFYRFRVNGIVRIAHVGVVAHLYNDGTMHVWEGNTDEAGGRTGGKVMLKRRSSHVTSGIGTAGYGYPAYDNGPPPGEPVPTSRQLVIRAGMTLSAVAAAAGITLSALLGANPTIKDPNTIRPGVVVTIPPTAPTSPPGSVLVPVPLTPQPTPQPTPPPPAPGRSASTLERGDHGAAVTALQRRLGITADGVFGVRTEAAVLAFQRSRGLLVDGVVGPKTRAALTSKATVRTARPTLTYGSRGDAVRVLQRELGVRADGLFGKKTLAAVKAAQKRYGLRRDGVVGPKTWAALTR